MPADVTKVFLTHLHSDHVISLPELYLYPWASQGRTTPFEVWGPDGTKPMMDHLQKAFVFDIHIHIRRDVDEKFPGSGIKVIATDIREGVVYQANGVKVTAFLVDHGPVKPAFGYRVEYRQHSVVLSRDTRPSENLVKFAKGADLLIHEVGARSKQDPIFTGPPDELLPNGRSCDKKTGEDDPGPPYRLVGGRQSVRDGEAETRGVLALPRRVRGDTSSRTANVRWPA